MNAITELGWTILIYLLVIGLPLLVVVLAFLIVRDEIKSKQQMKEFESLYRKCMLMHGPDFTKKLYDGCRAPWIGMENLLSVFRHHCGVSEKQKGKA